MKNFIKGILLALSLFVIGSYFGPKTLFASGLLQERNGVLCAAVPYANCIEIWNGFDMVVYSDEASTQTFSLDGATGNVDSEGTANFAGGVTLQSGIDLAGGTMTIDADDDTTLVASTDDLITLTLGAATGELSVITGNLTIGNGTPTVTQDGEDAYVEGQFEVDGEAQFDGAIDANGSTDFASGVTISGGDLTVAADVNVTAQTSITVTDSAAFTPTGTYQPITAAGEVTPTITAGATAGDIVILVNTSGQTVNLADSGTAKLTAAAALGQYDTLTLLSDGTNWVEISRTDN